MNESSVRLHLHHALQWRGFWPYHHPDTRVGRCNLGHVAYFRPEVKGRPDTEAKHPKFPTSWIEVKDVKGTSFEFSEISPEQRAYLSSWVGEGGGAYICIGKIVPAGSKTKIHSIYVIPWTEWLRAEEDILTLLNIKSMPYDYSLYTNKIEIRQPDLVTRFPKYRLEYNAGWHFRNDHPLAVMPEIEVPFFMRARKEKHEPIQAA